MSVLEELNTKVQDNHKIALLQFGKQNGLFVAQHTQGHSTKLSLNTKHLEPCRYENANNSLFSLKYKLLTYPWHALLCLLYIKSQNHLVIKRYYSRLPIAPKINTYFERNQCFYSAKTHY